MRRKCRSNPIYRYNCVAKFRPNTFYKFTDDTIVVGGIRNNGTMEHLVIWCQDNNLLSVVRRRMLLQRIGTLYISGTRSHKYIMIRDRAKFRYRTHEAAVLLLLIKTTVSLTFFRQGFFSRNITTLT